MSAKKIKVTLVKSTIGCLDDQKKTVAALGLKKIGSSKVFEENDAVRGMIFKVKHLIDVTEEI
ncbi:MAG: 50S ribosomal protein L30 [Firmicutes bacterium]|nr:50S ribosomal protein L30 [Bacillota bacterium]